MAQRKSKWCKEQQDGVQENHTFSGQAGEEEATEELRRKKGNRLGLGRWLVPRGSAWKREGKEMESVQALTRSVAQREGNPA